jgi:hypothetical protein
VVVEEESVEVEEDEVAVVVLETTGETTLGEEETEAVEESEESVVIIAESAINEAKGLTSATFSLVASESNKSLAW